jgi:glucose-6-phosphate isomerase
VKFRLGEHEAAVARRVGALVAAGAAERIWKRDATMWGGDAARRGSVANRLGWLDVASTMRSEAPVLEAFASEIRDARFTSAVLLGMGGSSLAPEVLSRSIATRAGCPRLHVLDTTDPETILGVERHVDLARTLFCVSSKSGGTIEVASLFAYFHARVSELKRERAGENFVAITDPGTSLQGLAEQHGFRRVFTNPPDIGGRYSALSYFGLVPAAVTGVDVARLLDAGIAAAEATRTPDSDALRLGAALGELALAGCNKCTFVVAAGVDVFGLWLEQLLAESTGKDGTGLLPVAGERLGAPRSYGDDRLFVQLRLAGDISGEQDSVIGALGTEGQPTITIDLEDEYDLGYEFFRWEFATAVAALVLGINPFDEPNVQESKENTARVLRETAKAHNGGSAAADPIGALAAAAAQLRSGDYLAIMAYVGQTEQRDNIFAQVRQRVRDGMGVATTVGYGPRFLHSTGQFHKGGPPQGVFLQITADDGEDAEIPGQPFTFRQLKHAQALGDFESLCARGRPVVRTNLGGDIDGGLQAMLRSMIEAPR